MIKMMREKSKMIDFDIVFFSAFIFIGVMFLLFLSGRLNFSMVDIHAETIPKESITSSSNLGEVEGTIESSVTFSDGGMINTTYGIGNTPVYTTLQITDYILGKGNELISILQTLAKPYFLVFLIIACGYTAIGFFIGTASKGLLAISVIAILYTAVLYASVIINILPSFCAS
jgi:hypothetical protein